MVSGNDCWCNLRYFSSRSPSQGFPPGPKNGQQPGAIFIILSSLRSAQLIPLVHCLSLRKTRSPVQNSHRVEAPQGPPHLAPATARPCAPRITRVISEANSCADLEGPQTYHLYVLSLCGRSQKHKVPTNWTYNWSPGLIFGATCTLFRAGAMPGAPGVRRGPQGAENRPKTRGRIYNFILPKVCPVVGCRPLPGLTSPQGSWDRPGKGPNSMWADFQPRRPKKMDFMQV